MTSQEGTANSKVLLLSIFLFNILVTSIVEDKIKWYYFIFANSFIILKDTKTIILMDNLNFENKIIFNF
jgi:hypothetical protein